MSFVEILTGQDEEQLNDLKETYEKYTPVEHLHIPHFSLKKI
jgi:hypothetical protein